MASALVRLRAATTPIEHADALWKAAIREAKGQDARFRGAGKESTDLRLARLRDALKGELVAFHDRLDVTAYQGATWQAASGRRLWQVKVPLSLFPKRDQGFDRVECTVEFAGDKETDWLRVVGVAPADRERVFVHTEIGFGTALQLETSNAQGVLPAIVAGAAAAGINFKDAGARVYGKADFDIARDLYRQCALAEIVRGIGTRWRLDDPHDQRLVSAESHLLTVILEVGDNVGPVSAAGYLQAFSSTRWMTATLESVWQHFTETVRSFFSRGVPVEAYAEWQDILKPTA